MGSISDRAEWVKDPESPQLRLRLQLQLRSDPWPENSMCHGAVKKKKKKKNVLFANLQSILRGPGGGGAGPVPGQERNIGGGWSKGVLLLDFGDLEHRGLPVSGILSPDWPWPSLFLTRKRMYPTADCVAFIPPHPLEGGGPPGMACGQTQASPGYRACRVGPDARLRGGDPGGLGLLGWGVTYLAR